MSIIDHIEPLTIDDVRGARYQNEYFALRRLAHGMESLYLQVKAQQERAVRVVNPDGGKSFALGNVPGLLEAGVDRAFISCVFDWYAINACRVFQLIGYVCNEYEGSESRIRDYCKRVLGPVLVYRNKVAAHYALTNPRGDNEADLYLSTLDTVAFETDRFFVGAIRAGLGRAGATVESQHDFHWSLTSFHEDVFLRRLQKQP